MTRWGRAIGIRPGEGRTVLLVAALFAALELGRGFGEIGVDTLVVKRFGAGSLPYLFIGLGTVSLVASLVYGGALGRLPRIRLFSGILRRGRDRAGRRADPHGDRAPGERRRWPTSRSTPSAPSR